MLAIRLETIRDLFDIKGMTKEMLRAVLTHPNIAIIDRDAEFPKIRMWPHTVDYELGFSHAEHYARKVGWVKGVKEKSVNNPS